MTFLCNLGEVNLPKLPLLDLDEHKKVFTISGKSVASLLKDKFPHQVFQEAREYDPIVAVCITGIVDYFVSLLGIYYIKWNLGGRKNKVLVSLGSLKNVSLISRILNITPVTVNINNSMYVNNISEYYNSIEIKLFTLWRTFAEEAVYDYCDRFSLKKPTRCTSVQPSGTKSLVPFVSPGIHWPKASYFIRRVTFAKEAPIAKACIDYGLNIIPSSSSIDENGVMLDDINHDLVKDWLVEFPSKVPYADLCDLIGTDLTNIPFQSQFELWKNCQKYYCNNGFNTSVTLELWEDEIDIASELIYEAIKEGWYITCAMLSRTNDTFPRMPFEPITKDIYEEQMQKVLERRKVDKSLEDIILSYYTQDTTEENPEAACDSGSCNLVKVSNSNER